MIVITDLGTQGAAPLVLRPSTSEGRGHYTWSLSSGLGPLRHPLALDLTDIACAVHLADRSIRRSRVLGKRMRRIRVELAVRRMDVWKRQAGRLEELLGFASADLWDLKFRKAAIPWKRTRSKDARCSASGVALFSGGLDSLCGAAVRAGGGEDWVFMTHSPPGREKADRLLRGVWTAFGREPSGMVPVSGKLAVNHRDSGGRRNLFQEPTRRTRPFFFLGLACAVAIDLGLRRVQMSENGALGLNLPFRRDAYGGAIARQAHTKMLREFAELLQLVAPRSVTWSVENPLEDRTKGEACELLGPAKGLARETLSCEYLGNQAACIKGWKKVHPRWARTQGIGDGPQCGICLPCLVRRAALHRAEIDDPDRLYFFDARRIAASSASDAPGKAGRAAVPPLRNYVLGQLFYMRRFCDRLRNMPPGEFMMEFLPELRWAVDPSGKPHTDSRMTYDLMRRYAVEILDFLEPSS